MINIGIYTSNFNKGREIALDLLSVCDKSLHINRNKSVNEEVYSIKDQINITIAYPSIDARGYRNHFIIFNKDIDSTWLEQMIMPSLNKPHESELYKDLEKMYFLDDSMRQLKEFIKTEEKLDKDKYNNIILVDSHSMIHKVYTMLKFGKDINIQTITNFSCTIIENLKDKDIVYVIMLKDQFLANLEVTGGITNGYKITDLTQGHDGTDLVFDDKNVLRKNLYHKDWFVVSEKDL